MTGESEFAGARPIPGLVVTALVIAAICLALPSPPATPAQAQAPARPTTASSGGLDAGDALASLFGGIAAGALLFSYEARGRPGGRRAGRKAHLP